MRKIRMIFITLLLSMAFAIPVFASDTTESQVLIDVRLKADVPDDFKSAVSIQYVGKHSEGFTATLNSSEEYTTVLSIPKDLYTYKQSSVADGYKLDCTKNFDLADAKQHTVYLLPVTVTNGSKSSEDDPALSNINVKFSIEKQVGVGEEFGDAISITYSGTEGNSVTATLNADNKWEVEMPIKKDLYTLAEISTSDNYAYDSLYSFNCKDVNSEQKYELPVKVYKKGDEPKEEPIKQELPTKQVIFTAQIPESVEFYGDIDLEYYGSDTGTFKTTLSKENGYRQVMELPLDSYNINYAVSYDTSVYSFSAQPTFVLDKATSGMQITVQMMKDGIVLTDEIIQEQIEQEQQLEQQNEEVQKNNSFGVTVVILILVIVGGFVFLIIYILKNKKKSSPVTIDTEDDDLDDIEDDD